MAYTHVAVTGQTNGGTGDPGPISLTTHTIGNFLLCTILGDPGIGKTVSALSATNISWSALTPGFSFTTNSGAYARTFIGVVTSVATASTSITWVGGLPTVFAGIVVREFSTTTGIPLLGNVAHVDSAGTTTWPNIYANVSGELYWGYCADGAAAAGSTPGFIYGTNDDAAGNADAYNLNVGPGTVTGPTWGNADHHYGEMVLVQPGPLLVQAGTPWVTPLSSRFGPSVPFSQPPPLISFSVVVAPAIATPGPIVAEQPSSSTPYTVTPNPQLFRNTLQDPPVLTTPGPIVKTQPTPTVPGVSIVTQAPQPPVVVAPTTTPGPIVVSQPNSASPYTVRQPAASFRNTLQDPPVLTTAPPIVVSQPTPTIPGQSILSQGHQDSSDFITTRSSRVIVVNPQTPVIPGNVIVSSGHEDPSDFNTKTQTIVETPPTAIPQPTVPQPQLFRNSLQDAPVLTTNPPIVKTQPSPTIPGFAYTSQAPFIPPPSVGPTTYPVVVNQPNSASPYTVTPAPQTFRNTLVDPPVLTTAPPIVVSSQPVVIPGKTITSQGQEDPSDFNSKTRIVVSTQPSPTIPGSVDLIQAPQPFIPPTFGPTTIPLVVNQPNSASPYTVTPQPDTFRNTLQDPPVLTTPPPIVQSQPSPVIAGQIIVIQTSQLGTTPSFSPTTEPIVVEQPTSASPYTVTPVPQLFRNTKQDPPVLTTPAPIIVTQPTPTIPGQSIIRHGIQDPSDFGTPHTSRTIVYGIPGITPTGPGLGSVRIAQGFRPPPLFIPPLGGTVGAFDRPAHTVGTFDKLVMATAASNVAARSVTAKDKGEATVGAYDRPANSTGAYDSLP